MKYRRLGRSGLNVSAIGLGTNQFGGKVDGKGVAGLLAQALDRGVNFIDTADIYQDGRSEETLGDALAEHARDDFIVATKVAMRVGAGPNDRGASRHRILNGAQLSCRRLKTDRIDLYQIHEWDESTPIEETLRALDDLVRAGTVRYVGASNFAAWQLAQANVTAELRGWTAFVSVQPHHHMLERGIEQELVPYCQADGIGIIPYFPLAGGFLTGKYQRAAPAPRGSRGETSKYVQSYMTDAGYDAIAELMQWANARSHSLTELALAWLLARPQVSSVIAGATSADQFDTNVAAADWELSGAEVEEIDAILALH